MVLVEIKDVDQTAATAHASRYRDLAKDQVRAAIVFGPSPRYFDRDVRVGSTIRRGVFIPRLIKAARTADPEQGLDMKASRNPGSNGEGQLLRPLEAGSSSATFVLVMRGL